MKLASAGLPPGTCLARLHTCVGQAGKACLTRTLDGYPAGESLIFSTEIIRASWNSTFRYCADWD
jgi:hypothetical protein